MPIDFIDAHIHAHSRSGENFGRLVLSTDKGANASWLFGIPAAISAMQDRGLGDDAIRAVVYDNAAGLLGL